MKKRASAASFFIARSSMNLRSFESSPSWRSSISFDMSGR